MITTANSSITLAGQPYVLWASNTTAVTSTSYGTNAVWWGNLAPIPVQQIPPTPASPPREFNRYVNASDLLEEFIYWLREQRVRQADVMQLPIELFIKWLVVQACEQDGDEPDVVLIAPPRRPQPRCLGCQRFMPAVARLPLHDERCAGYIWQRERGAIALTGNRG